MSKKPRTITEILRDINVPVKDASGRKAGMRPKGGALAHLLAAAEHHQSCTAQLRALLPEPLAGHCSVTDIRGKRLTVSVSNSSWATRLRFEIPGLLPKLTALADFAEVEDVRILSMQSGGRQSGGGQSGGGQSGGGQSGGRQSGGGHSEPKDD